MPSSQAEPALLSIAESLISTYYPSAAISQIASEVLSSTVVINSKTYVVHGPTVTPSTTSSSASSTPTSHSTSSHSTISRPTTLKPITRFSVSSSPSQTPSASSTVTSQSTHNLHNNHNDENLAIILGSIFGILVLALILVLLFCLCRRKRRHGSFFKGHDDTPQESRRSSLTRWIPPTPAGLGTTTLISAGGGHDGDNHGRYTHSAAPPQMSHSTNPVFLGRHWQQHHHDRNPNSESRPLVADTTGIVGADSGSTHNTSARNTQELTSDAMQPYELDHEETNRPGLFPPSNTIANNFHNMDNSERAPTPYLPALLMPGHHGRSISDPPFQQQYNPSPPQQQQQQQQQQNQGYFQQHSNSSRRHRNDNGNNNKGRFFPSRYPSSHYEDDDEEEARDLISPIVPVRSADRLPRSPLVHYPSWDEVSEFDFEGESGHGYGNGNGRGGGAGRWSS